MRNEQWLPAVGWEGKYEVSNFGNVRGLDRILDVTKDGVVVKQTSRRGGPIKSRANKSGHLVVCLPPPNGVARNSKHNRNIYVHRLVLEAFVGPAPEGMICLHRNGNPSDNNLENLHWDTRSENTRDTYRHAVEQARSELLEKIAQLEDRLSRCECGC